MSHTKERAASWDQQHGGSHTEMQVSHSHLQLDCTPTSTKRQGDDLDQRYVPMGSLAAELDAFLLDVQMANRAEGTLRFYRQKLRPFVNALQAQGIVAPEQIQPAHLRAYMASLSANREPGGCAAYWRAIRAFMRFLVREGVLDRNPLNSLRAPRVDQEPLEPIDPEVLNALLASFEKSETGLRDRSLMLTLLDTGLRAGEAIALNVADFDPRDGAILVRHSKSRKPRTVFVAKEARRALLAYLRLRGNPDPTKPLWVTCGQVGEGHRLTYSGLREMIQRRAKATGVPAPTLHAFRRTFAITMLRAGADVVSLSRLMGHGSLPVLMRYLKQERGDLGRVHAACSPADALYRKPGSAGGNTARGAR